MAAITSDEDFRMACNWLIDHDQLPVTGEREVNAAERKVYDQTAPGIENRVDITPSQAVLEAALDSALAAVASDNELREARAALEQGRIYFRNQLVSSTPHNPQTMVGNIKPVIDGNAKLLNAITNQVNLLVLALGWTSADVLNPTTNPNRARYLMACQLIFGTVADVS